MGIFDKFKRDKNKTVTIHSTAVGKVIPIEDVADPVFSQKMMGEGFGIMPTDGRVYSPVEGVVKSVFPTRHAISLKLEHGTELLVHMGIDTVELDGKPFETLVEEGERVTPETVLSQMDLESLAAADKDPTIIVVFPQVEQIESFDLTLSGETEAGTVIGELTLKEE